MSRKNVPKPEELIAKLDGKFETFKEEITELIAQKNTEIEQITAKDLERTNKVVEYYLGSWDNIDKDHVQGLFDMFTDTASYGNYKTIQYLQFNVFIS